MSRLESAAHRARKLARAAEAERVVGDGRLARILRGATDAELKRVRDLLVVDPAKAAAVVRGLAERPECELGDAVTSELRRRDPTSAPPGSSPVPAGLTLEELREFIAILKAGRPTPDDLVDLADLSAAAARRAEQLLARGRLRLLLGVDSRSCRRSAARGCDCLGRALDAFSDTPGLRALGLPGLRAVARHIHDTQRRRGRAR